MRLSGKPGSSASGSAGDPKPTPSQGAPALLSKGRNVSQREEI